MIACEDVAPGVVRLPVRTPTLPPATTTNTLFVGRDSFVVIEPATPYDDERARLDALVEQRLVGGASFVGVMLTHHHPDHTGHVEGLQRRFGGSVFAHRETARRIPITVDRLLDDGDVVDLRGGMAIEAVFTPGHAPGHLAYRERSTGVVYAGDMVASEGTIVVDPEDDGDMAAYLCSLERLRELRAACLVPSHGGVIHEVDALLQHYLRHRKAREDKLLAALARGAHTFDDLLARTYDDTPSFLHPLAARSLEAHLRKLEQEARIIREDVRIRMGDG